MLPVRPRIFQRPNFMPDNLTAIRHAPIRGTRAHDTRLHGRNGGFTLLELLVVMVIIGLLVGYVGPKYFTQVGKSEIKATKAQINAFEKALDQYRLDTGHYPTTEQGLNAIVARPANEPKWQGPYLTKAVPVDPWGNPTLPAAGDREFDCVSQGRIPAATTRRPE